MDTNATQTACARSRARSWTRPLGRGLTLVACLAHAGCATRPENVEAHYVSPTTYQNWSCDQLQDEKIRLTKEVDRISGLQRENANADTAMMTVGLIVLWPVLFGLAVTKDRKAELGRIKGEYEAVDLSVRGKQCTAPAPGVPSEPAVSTPQSAALIASAGGTYKGKGKTDAWCQTPVLTVVLRGTAAEGGLSETSSGATTSAIIGTVDNAGIIALEFKGTGADYFTGKADGALKANVLTMDIRSKAAKACNYHFELQKADKG